jgi:hypothetical protein
VAAGRGALIRDVKSQLAIWWVGLLGSWVSAFPPSRQQQAEKESLKYGSRASSTFYRPTGSSGSQLPASQNRATIRSSIRHSEASVRYYNLKKTAVVLTLAALIVTALWALGLLRTGTVAY